MIRFPFFQKKKPLKTKDTSMPRLLHISASPRKTSSKSRDLAQAHITSRQSASPDLIVDTFDLWEEDLPQFDGDWAAAKMTFFGEGEMNRKLEQTWEKVTQITERFVSADHYVINAPMWNGGVPYRLKQYIDIITQPGLLFGFDPEAGYSGLLSGKSATLITTSGVWAPGADPKYGSDFHSNYLEWWLEMIGVDDVRTIRFQPTLLTNDPAAGFDAALAALT